ncbi:MAG TPA: type 4a pilus biogenesis protein PilO [Desulfuromonadaceae bacterium]
MKQLLLELFQQKRRSLIMVVVLLLVNVAFYAIVNGYQAAALKKARAKWAGLRSRLAAIERGDVNARYRQGKTDLEKLYTHIPVRRQFPRMLGDILDIAASNGVATGAITYKPQSIKEQKLLAYGVTIGVSGSYAAVKSFLADLQKSNELIVVENIGLTNSDPFEELVVLDLQLTVYLQEGA